MAYNNALILACDCMQILLYFLFALAFEICAEVLTMLQVTHLGHH